MGGRGGQSVSSVSAASAVATYQSTLFDAINNELRYDVPDKYKGIIKKLDSTAKDVTNDVVYRGVSGQYRKDLLSKYGLTGEQSIDKIKAALIGKTITDKAFVSTTRSLSVAGDFARDRQDGNGQGIAFQISGKKTGIEVLKYVQNRRAKLEREFLLKRNSRFIITNVGFSKSGKLILYLNAI